MLISVLEVGACAQNCRTSSVKQSYQPTKLSVVRSWSEARSTQGQLWYSFGSSTLVLLRLSLMAGRYKLGWPGLVRLFQILLRRKTGWGLFLTTIVIFYSVPIMLYVCFCIYVLPEGPARGD